MMVSARRSWANINAERQTLRFVAEKTKRGNKGKGEEYPLHPDILTYLGRLKAGDNPKAFLFPSLCDKQSGGVGGLSLIFRKWVMTKAGIHADEESEAKPKGKGRRFFSLGFHSLRHTAISEQANRGIAEEIRMKLSGHKSKVHQQYTHHELEVLRKEIEKVPSFL
jgi:integrase